MVIGQEAWCHVPDKPTLIAECARVVKPGGTIAFTDILRRPGLSEAELARLTSGMPFPTLESLEGYSGLLAGRDCEVLICEDLSEEWARILVQRLAMYRGLKEETVRKFGAEHFRRMGRDVRLLRRAVSGGQARRRAVRGAAVSP